MTYNEFLSIVSQFNILPEVALDDQEVVSCLKSIRDASHRQEYMFLNKKLIRILKSQF